MQKILIAEDDSDIVKLMTLYLENQGFAVTWAADGQIALDLFKDGLFDLMIVDIMMPRVDGFTLVKKIREFSNVPIIIVSATQVDNNKILGLDLGADDYIVKPFNPFELVARVKALLRRVSPDTKPQDDNILQLGELKLDTRMLSLEKNGNPILLTATEYKILAMLMSNPGRVYTKMQIYEEVNGDYYESDDNTMMVHISNLRDKIEDDPKNPKYIKTIRGLGYKIEKI